MSIPSHQVYRLSKKFSPPKIDLVRGRSLDDYWEDDDPKRKPMHRDPTDVTRRELERYHDVWAFLDATDLIFYIYPVLFHSSSDSKPSAFLEGWLRAADSRLDLILAELNSRQVADFAQALVGSFPQSDSDEYPQLVRLISERVSS